MTKLQTYGALLLAAIVLWFGWLHLANNLRDEGARMVQSHVRDSSAKAQQKSIAAYTDSLKDARARAKRAEEKVAVWGRRADSAGVVAQNDARELTELVAKCNDPALTAKVDSLTTHIAGLIATSIAERLQAADALAEQKEVARLATAQKDSAVALAETKQGQLGDKDEVISRERRHKWLARASLLVLGALWVWKH